MNLFQENHYVVDPAPQPKESSISNRNHAITNEYQDGSHLQTGIVHFQDYDFIYFYRIRSEGDEKLFASENTLLKIASDFMSLLFQRG